MGTPQNPVDWPKEKRQAFEDEINHPDSRMAQFRAEWDNPKKMPKNNALPLASLAVRLDEMIKAGITDPFITVWATDINKRILLETANCNGEFFRQWASALDIIRDRKSLNPSSTNGRVWEAFKHLWKLNGMMPTSALLKDEINRRHFEERLRDIDKSNYSNARAALGLSNLP